MRDLRKDLRQYIDLRRSLGYKLRKHEPRLTEFIAFLEAKSSDRITTKLAIAWATESSKDHKHSCFERLSFIRSFARHVSSMDARTEFHQQARCAGPRSPFGHTSILRKKSTGSWQQRAMCFHRTDSAATRITIWSDCWPQLVCAAAKRFGL